MHLRFLSNHSGHEELIQWSYTFTVHNTYVLCKRHTLMSLQWRHNERDGVSNHQTHDCLLNRLFSRRSKKTSNLRVTGLYEGNSLVTGEFSAQRASNANNISIWWRHHIPPIYGCDVMWCQVLRWTCRLVYPLMSSTNTLRPRQNVRHFADNTFKRIFLSENVDISIKISLKFVPKGPISNIQPLVQIMAWHRPGDKALSEPMMVRLPTHICVTRPQWANLV